MNKIIGRKEEQQELNEAFNSNRAELIIMYGRIRVGKTFLIEQFFIAKTCIFFHVTGVQNGLLKEQLEEFTKGIGKSFYNGATIESKAAGSVPNLSQSITASKRVLPIVAILTVRFSFDLIVMKSPIRPVGTSSTELTTCLFFFLKITCHYK